MRAALDSAWIGTGPRVAKFEQAFRDYIGAEHAIAVNSCTAALHLSMVAAGVGPGDEVLTTPMTFCATINAIIHTGATPVLVDVDPQTMILNPDNLEASLSEKTKAILPVHFAGRPADVDALQAIAARHGLLLIEDAAHAIETRIRGRKVGAIGDFTCFSFYATKNITTGEGGMVTTNNEALAAQIKIMALHGMSKDAWMRYSDDGYRHYGVVAAGFKYNMTDMQAALGIHQLARIDDWLKIREAQWARYDEALQDLPLILPAPPQPETTHARHLYTVLIDTEQTTMTRDRLLVELHQRNIGAGVHYRAVHEHPYYQERYGWQRGAFPHAEYISDRTLSLPLSPSYEPEDIEDVIAALHEVAW